MIKYYISDEAQLDQFAKVLGRVLQPGLVVYLSGPLGAGKTALVRGILASWGITDKVKSPTYTLVESYTHQPYVINHFDLYRLAAPDELDYLGVRDYFNENTICFIEWPEKGQGCLPLADITCYIDIQLPGRSIVLDANTSRGRDELAHFCYEPTS